MLAGMINTDTILVTQELLALLSNVDEFKDRYRNSDSRERSIVDVLLFVVPTARSSAAYRGK